MRTKNIAKIAYVTILLAGLIALLSLTGYFLGGKPPSSGGNATLIIKAFDIEKTERFKFTRGTPLGILKYNHKVDTFLNNNHIECIDDVCADGNYMWVFYINNKTINYGVKRYKLNDGDVIMFEFANRNIGEKE